MFGLIDLLTTLNNGKFIVSQHFHFYNLNLPCSLQYTTIYVSLVSLITLLFFTLFKNSIVDTRKKLL
jgi:hypothetical protein